MIINFKIHGISRDTRKLIKKSTLMIIITNQKKKHAPHIQQMRLQE
jgi:hypothetical protein